MQTVGILDLGTPELIIILAIVLLLFGGKRIPELSRSIGTSMRELRKGLSDDQKDEKSEKQVKDNRQETVS